MKSRTFYLETLGCRANQADSAALHRQLEELNYRVASPESADVVVINTCTVTHRADQDSRQTIRKLQRRNSRARLIVTGCYAQRSPGDLSRIEGVHWVVGNACRERIPELVQISDQGENVCQVLDQDWSKAEIPFSTPAASAGRTRPFVKIQDGCDSRCSYCVVPFVRGRARSAPPDVILDQIKSLIAEGRQEIVLTGIHLGTYGRKLDQKTSLTQLVARIIQLPGLGRLRLSCIEPMRFGLSLLRLAAQHRVIAPHFHIPLQSGSARILAAMRRPYQPNHYLKLVSAIRCRLPDAAIGADVLVGFPGETEEEHRQSMHFVAASPLSHLHVFPYSNRSGTEAGRWKQTPPGVIKRRSREFRQLAESKKLAFEKRFLGRRLRGLIVQRRDEVGGMEVLTGNYLRVLLPDIRLETNRWVDVVPERITPKGVFGSADIRVASLDW